MPRPGVLIISQVMEMMVGKEGKVKDVNCFPNHFASFFNCLLRKGRQETNV